MGSDDNAVRKNPKLDNLSRDSHMVAVDRAESLGMMGGASMNALSLMLTEGRGEKGRTEEGRGEPAWRASLADCNISILAACTSMILSCII